LARRTRCRYCVRTTPVQRSQAYGVRAVALQYLFGPIQIVKAAPLASVLADSPGRLNARCATCQCPNTFSLLLTFCRKTPPPYRADEYLGIAAVPGAWCTSTPRTSPLWLHGLGSVYPSWTSRCRRWVPKLNEIVLGLNGSQMTGPAGRSTLVSCVSTIPSGLSQSLSRLSEKPIHRRPTGRGAA